MRESVTALAASLNHLIRAQQHRLRDREAERPGGLEVEHELELGGLNDRNIFRLGALEDRTDVDAGLSVCVA